MKKFKYFVADTNKGRTHETEHGTVNVKTHVKGFAWRVKHPNVKNHFGQVIKRTEHHAGEIPRHEKYKVEIRGSSGVLKGDEALVPTRKSGIRRAAWFLKRGYYD